MLSGIGEFLFTVVISYMGAIELLFMAKQLYHLAFQHQKREMLLANDRSLKQLQDRIESEIVEATGREILGFNAMKDGILYKDGFRINPSEINNDNNSGQQIQQQHQEIDVVKILEKNKNLKNVESDVTTMTEELASESKDIEVHEEQCFRKQVESSFSNQQKINENINTTEDQRTNLIQNIKTQFDQTKIEEYALPSSEFEKSKEIEEISFSKQNQFSPTQKSSSLVSENLKEDKSEEQNIAEPQYSDEYLRSLDGIKTRSLVRDDGNRRRRAFKKRCSSGSTSSQESRASREEELKMFTSLEEEESESIRRGDSTYVPIRYSSDPNLIKIEKHQRRHKKSPVKDTYRPETETTKSSLEQLEEETNVQNPWGEVKHEHYKDSEFWKREKRVSIEEENEECAQTWHDDSKKAHAGEIKESFTQAKNMPKSSSFEVATPLQNKDAVLVMNPENQQDKAQKYSNIEDLENVSNNIAMTTLQIEKLIESHDLKASNETGSEMDACHKLQDEFLKQRDVLHDLEEQSVKVLQNIPPFTKINFSNDNDSECTFKITNMEPKITVCPESTSENSNSSSDVISSFIEKEINSCENLSANRSKTPPVQVEQSRKNNISVQFNVNCKTLTNPTILEGISDFYDFNASINSFRQLSVKNASMSVKDIKRQSNQEKSSLNPIETLSGQKLLHSHINSPILFEHNNSTVIVKPGISDFYDFCVLMNHTVRNVKKNTDYITIPRSTTDFLYHKLNIIISKPKSPFSSLELLESPFDKNFPSEQRNFLNNATPSSIENFKSNSSILSAENGGTKSKYKWENVNSIYTPETPEYKRSFSANIRYIESMREEYRQNIFKRSRYVGESMDFENDFEDLREQTRHFRRSRSRSRTPPSCESEDYLWSSQEAAKIKDRQKLQDKILAEITKTTMNYQDFSCDQNEIFMDYERRVSDSALLQKPQILIQIDDTKKKKSIEDFCENESYNEKLNELEGEEYHHFRRFSLNQEEQIDNDYIYLENYETLHRKFDVNQQLQADWMQQKEISSDISNEFIPLKTEVITEDGSDRVEADDIDTESEDDRQTVVEVEDEIDEDVTDYERSEEFTNNEQSECEEAEREMDRYANKNADDWKNEEGAVGGIEKDEEPKITDIELIENFEAIKNFDAMYINALENTEESGIQRDYETIVNTINECSEKDFQSSFSDSESIKTADLLEEILQEDTEKNKNYSLSRNNKKEKLDNFVEEEVEWSTTAPVSKEAKVVSIKSVRLRSRYGLHPSPVHRNFDDVDDVNLNYKPKREYKWRKNFKLDEDNEMSEKENLENGNKNGDLSTDNSVDNENFKTLLLKSNLDFDFNDQMNFVDSENVQQSKELNTFGMSCEPTESEKKDEITPNNVNISEKDLRKMSNDQDIFRETETITKKKKLKKKSKKVSKGDMRQETKTLLNLTGATAETISEDNVLDKKESNKSASLDSSMNFSSSSQISESILNESKSKEDKSSKSSMIIKMESISAADLKDINNPAKKSLMPPEPLSNHIISNSTSESPAEQNELPLLKIKDSKSCSMMETSQKVENERTDSTGVYELIKDGSMYPWF